VRYAEVTPCTRSDHSMLAVVEEEVVATGVIGVLQYTVAAGLEVPAGFGMDHIRQTHPMLAGLG
jgi:hypothetical protein